MAAGEEGANVMAAKVVPANVVPANAVAADVKPLPKLSPNGREQSPAMIPQQDKPTQETTNKKFRRGSWSRDECQQFLALLSKRGSYLGRSPFLLLPAWILPVAIAYLATTTLTARQVDTGMLPRKIAVSALAQFGTGARAFLHEMTTDNCSINYRVLLESQAAAIDKVQNPQVKLLDSLERDYVLYASTYPMGAELYQRTITGWYNPAAIMSLLVQNNLMQSANLRAATNKRDLRIYTNLTLDLMPDDLLRIISDRDDDEMLQQLKLAVEQNWAYWGCMVTVSMGLLLSPFVALPAAENHSGVRGLQLMSGVSGCVYVTAHFTFDFLFYFVPMSTIYGGFIYLQQLSLETGVALFTIVLVFAPIGILLPYIVAEHITSESTANSVIMGIYALGGPAAFLLFLTSVTAFRSQALSIPLLIFPPFLLGAATIRAVNLEYEAAMCNDLRSRSSVDKTLVNFCDEMRLLGSGIIHCCKMLTSDSKKEAWQVTGPFSFSWYSIQAPLTLMVALSACLFTYAVHKASGDIFGEEKLQDLHTPALDEDVENEKQLVNTIVREKKLAEYTLVARNLHKFFGEFYAVRGIYLALRPGECFGLVGVNGAGKTTTFQMLAALIPMTDGNAYMKTLVLNKAPRQWQAHIGYCPQRDSLLGKLNAYETLFLFGRLRGVPERVLAVMVQELIIKVDLEEYAAKPCECYSLMVHVGFSQCAVGGNKRKLSIATAMVGFPPVVFLDEPFAGVDVASRIHIQRVLADVKVATKTTFILTTHNMEECEEACDRIGIMVKGQMTCLGPMWHLRVKFGGSLTLKFKLAEGAKVDDEQLDTAVLQAFPGAKRLEGKDRVQKVAEYRLQYRIPWSVLFQRVAALRKAFTFDHIVVSDSSLEQLLVAFARKARKEAELEPED
ncbi:phospholipid-transporting ATPase ABCA1-like [Amblyomma americanum]